MPKNILIISSNGLEGHGGYVYHNELQMLFSNLPKNDYSVVTCKPNTHVEKVSSQFAKHLTKADFAFSFNGLYSVPYYLNRYNTVPLFRDFIATTTWSGILQEILMMPLSSTDDLIICPSKYAQRVLQRIAVKPATIFFHGVIFPRSIPVPVISARHEKKRIVYLGRVTSDKNIIVLFQVLKGIIEQIKDVELFIVGPTYGKKGLLEEFCIRYGLENNVIFKEFVSEEEKWQILTDCDLMLFPSTSIAESNPRVIAEAFFAGLPVVAVDWAGISETVTHGEEGFLVKAFPLKELPEFTIETVPLAAPDIQAMIEYSLKLLNDNALQRKMSEKAKEKALKLSLNRNFNEILLPLYEQINPLHAMSYDALKSSRMQDMSSVFSERFLELVDFKNMTYKQIVEKSLKYEKEGRIIPSAAELGIEINNQLWSYLVGL